MPAQPPPSAVPVVPGYVLEELLGRGGSGQVWRARPRAGGPPVAVKVLLRGDPERQEREAVLLGELDHPHLVRLHEVVRSQPRAAPAQVALVLDLLAGGSLADLLARRGRLRPGEVVTTVAPVAAALAHAHERGIVHGDLSPGNVVFTAEGRPVLTDLGTARLVGDTARAEVTPPYVDPVVAAGGAPGPASDVFGVAAAAFHALTGIAPWNAADAPSTLIVAATGELPDLALLAPEAPAELVRVVQRGLSAEPHLRGSAAAFALDLRHSCRPEPVQLPVAGVPDAELGRPGVGPRTELTHQVPGQRPRAVHAAPLPFGPLARLRAAVAARLGRQPSPTGLLGAVLRRVVVIGAVLVAVAAGLAGAAWAGASWGSGPDAAAPAADRGTPAGNSSAASASAAPATDEAPPGDGPVDPGGPLADRSTPPTDDAGWTALLTELYARRVTAFTTASPEALAGVYVPGSPLLDRDTAAVRALAEAGQTVSGFAPEVRRLLGVETTGDRIVLRLVDDLPAYRVVVGGSTEDPPTEDRPTGTASAQEVAGRGEAEVRIEVQSTAAGWRIIDARVEP
jgi:hypothetical protein